MHDVHNNSRHLVKINTKWRAQPHNPCRIDAQPTSLTPTSTDAQSLANSLHLATTRPGRFVPNLCAQPRNPCRSLAYRDVARSLHTRYIIFATTLTISPQTCHVRATPQPLSQPCLSRCGARPTTTPPPSPPSPQPNQAASRPRPPLAV